MNLFHEGTMTRPGNLAGADYKNPVYSGKNIFIIRAMIGPGSLAGAFIKHGYASG